MNWVGKICGKPKSQQIYAPTMSFDIPAKAYDNFMGCYSSLLSDEHQLALRERCRSLLPKGQFALARWHLS